MRILFGPVAQKVHQSDAATLKWPFKKIDMATGAHVNMWIVGGVGMATLVMSARRLTGCRWLSAVIASAVLAVWSSDRLGRSFKHLIEVLETIRGTGCGLYIHTQAVDTTTPAGRALFGMLGIFQGGQDGCGRCQPW